MGGSGSSSGKGGSSYRVPSKETAFEPGTDPEFRYHSTSFAAAKRIQEEGIKPSTRGAEGPGVYFGTSIENTMGWTSESKEAVQMRVKRETLRKKYTYTDLDQYQGTAERTVSPKYVEIRTSFGDWVPIKDAIIRRKGKSGWLIDSKYF